MELTKEHISIMKHTVSGPDRNWFGTGSKGNDAKLFNELVNEGYANVQEAPSWSGDDVIYSLTNKGKEALS